MSSEIDEELIRKVSQGCAAVLLIVIALFTAYLVFLAWVLSQIV